MRTLISFCIFSLIICMNATAQTAVDKANEAIYKADQAKATFEKIKGLFPKKKKNADTAKAAIVTKDTVKADTTNSAVFAGSQKTEISISGIDFSTLKKLNENVQVCASVISAKMKYNSALSTIEVIHSGTTEDLLKLMEETSKDIFTEKQIESFEEGKISLKLK
ncbi:hypothetical protein BH10BAC2_BH10BAC2_27170 [soil metagenome]